MRIELKKFGTTLVSRPLGREAFLAFSPSLSDVKDGDKLEIDFSGVSTLSPSWGDEFITPLHKRFGENLILLPSDNPSVKLTIEVLEQANGVIFKK
jgi:hypothetical protein